MGTLLWSAAVRRDSVPAESTRARSGLSRKTAPPIESRPLDTKRARSAHGLLAVYWLSGRVGVCAARLVAPGAAAVNRIGVLGVLSLGAVARLLPASDRRVPIREGVRP